MKCTYDSLCLLAKVRLFTKLGRKGLNVINSIYISRKILMAMKERRLNLGYIIFFPFFLPPINCSKMLKRQQKFKATILHIDLSSIVFDFNSLSFQGWCNQQKQHLQLSDSEQGNAARKFHKPPRLACKFLSTSNLSG